MIFSLTTPDRYTCTAQSPTFFGCCTSNPCRGDNTGCPNADLRAAGIGSGTNPDTTQNGTYWPNTQCAKGQWWSCDVPQTPTFQGCCDVNPCSAAGCPAGSLQQAAFITVPAELSPTATATSTSSTSSPTQTSTSSSSPLPDSSGGSSSNIGAIAGGVGGGVAILILGLLILWLCRRRRQKKHNVSLGERNDASKGSMGTGGLFQKSESKAQKSGMSPQKELFSWFPNIRKYLGCADKMPKARYSLLGIPLSSKYAPVSMSSPPVSPGPPPYHTPQQSPNPDVHELDSNHLHEVGDMVQPSAAVQALHHRPISSGLESAIVPFSYRSSDQFAELPTPAGASRWSSRKPTGIESVEIGDGSPRTGFNTPTSAMLSSHGNERVSYGTPRRTTLTPSSGMLSPNESERRQKGEIVM